MTPSLELRCPACGGKAQISHRGPDGRDRVLTCAYCGSESDLPETRGTTRERVTEAPGERTVERVTSWEGLAPQAVPWSDAAGDVPGGVAVERIELEVDGQRFDSPEALEAHLREQLPTDVADDVLDAIRSEIARPPGPQTRERTTEYTSVQTRCEQIDIEVGDGGRRRGLLGRLRDLLRRR